MTYIIICFIWALYSRYRQLTDYKYPFNCLKNVILATIINFIVCPYAIYVAIKNDKI